MNNYFTIRKKFYKDVLIKFKKNKLGKNYSKFKAFICLEFGIIFAYFFSIFKIKPNVITLIFILIVILASILLGSKVGNLVNIGVLIFFLKNSLDLTDGFIARLNKQTSPLGHILDTWAGTISIIFFQIGVGLFVFSKDSNLVYIFLLFSIIIFQTIDFKKHYLTEFKKVKKKNIIEYKNEFKNKHKKNLILRLFQILDYDGRSRYTDLVLLLIVLEHNYNLFFLTKYVLLLWFFTNLSKFFYKFLRTYKLIQNNS